jgi:dipeptidyl aminopeptidase/acylaminoacyl peptidase
VNGGITEHKDIIAAFDFLIAANVAADRIGMFASSLGSPSTLLAVANEPRMTKVQLAQPALVDPNHHRHRPH